MDQETTGKEHCPHYDVVIVGAGFAGLYMLHRARKQGLKALVIDKADDVGGCWYSTRYPGLRCDVASLQYSYSFDEEIQQEWSWPDKYSTQADILKYIQYVADKLDLRRDIRFNTAVTAATWHESGHYWEVASDAGDTLTSRFCVMATGALSIPVYPDIQGLQDFDGDLIHTSAWPKHLQDFTGRKVALIGTGSSGVQIASAISSQVDSLHVLQRTVPYVLELRNEPMDPAHEAEVKRNYPAYRQRMAHEGAAMIFDFLQRKSVWDFTEEELQAELERCWRSGNSIISLTFTDSTTDRKANDKIAEFIRSKISEIVKDPAKRERLMPTTRYGAKRLAISTNYYEIFNKPNIDVISLLDTPIQKITKNSIVTTDQEVEIDTLILATGYDAGTGPLQHIDVTGVDGLKLTEKWSEKPSCYLGLMVAGFPNMFVVTGPGSPGVLANMVFAIEQHVDWISDCLSYLNHHGRTRIEADGKAELDWFDHVNDIASNTILLDIDTWYNGGNIEGKPKYLMFYAGGVPAYSGELMRRVNDGYRGFRIAT